ncbi:hypothetical protein R5W24_003013 [Gemmata sp. JC717]|uniref:hypothetical protein n=1 Tax=Gemmata algarum TaxID=2975278 RepID=UPI0021BAC168|nr:hypothetical protein [Gemmata algarum]MDY3553899.1 hypothetical protein [Gemmata algarum]
MTLPIGRLIDGDEGRDAVHVAIAPTTAPCELRPGQHVDPRGNPEGPGVVPVGIVDPFLREPVPAGRRFWLFLYPNTVTTLRHEWSHPAYPTNSPAEVNQAIQDYLTQRKRAQA